MRIHLTDKHLNCEVEKRLFTSVRMNIIQQTTETTENKEEKLIFVYSDISMYK